MYSRTIADAQAGERLLPAAAVDGAAYDAYGCGETDLRQRRVDVARIEIAALRILQRVEDCGSIGDGATLDTAAIEIRIGADRAAKRNQSFRRDEGDDVVAPRRLAARAAGLFADGALHEVRGDASR